MSKYGRTIFGNENRRYHSLQIRLGLVAAALLITATTATKVQAAIPQSERDVLTAFYANTAGAGWTNNTGWNSSAGTECSWFGITCDGAQAHVTQINLTSNNLTGSLPGLSALINLVRLDLYNNHLSGSIPSLSGLSNIQFFSIPVNNLTGTIPALSGLVSLSYFNVGTNQLSGPMPSLVGLSNLDTFQVDRNQLTGPLPSFAGLINLRAFRIAGNRFNGNMPTPPNPGLLVAGQSTLCSNELERMPNPAWDLATGVTPWFQHCGPPSGITTPTGSLHYPRRQHTATRLLDGRVLIAGGIDPALAPAMINVPIAEIYDPATGSFTDVGSLNQGKGRRETMSNLLADGKVLIAGGYDAVTGILSSAELFNPTTNQFTYTGIMAAPRTLYASATLTDGRVVIIGGYGSLTTAEIFNPATGQFTATGMLNQSRVYDRAITMAGGKVLVKGAEDGGLSNELYDPVAGTFAYTASFIQSTSTGGLVLLEDGRVLGAGGFYQGGYSSTAQIFNPATGQFTLTGGMAEGRNAHQLTALNNGLVLASGSFYGSATMELYDPQVGQFRPALNMTSARGDHTVTLLLNGRVLIVGGTPSNGSTVLASAEIYTPDLVRRSGFD